MTATQGIDRLAPYRCDVCGGLVEGGVCWDGCPASTPPPADGAADDAPESPVAARPWTEVPW